MSGLPATLWSNFSVETIHLSRGSYSTGQSHRRKPVVRGKDPLDFLPYLGKAVAINAEIPFAEISKRSDLHLIVSVAQPLCNLADQGLSKEGRGILTPEMGKGMEYNDLKLSLVSQPLDML